MGKVKAERLISKRKGVSRRLVQLIVFKNKNTQEDEILGLTIAGDIVRGETYEEFIINYKEMIK